MSPYPAQVNREQIIEVAWDIVDKLGPEKLALGRLASQLGVRAPSLYRHVKSKDTLFKGVNELTNARLFDAINAALDALPQASAADKMLAVARAYRGFALAHPKAYSLAFSTRAEDARPAADEQEADVLPLQAIMAEISGEADSLAALRGALALLHGFALLEIHGQLRRGGDLEADFLTAFRAYLDGWRR